MLAQSIYMYMYKENNLTIPGSLNSYHENVTFKINCTSKQLSHHNLSFFFTFPEIRMAFFNKIYSMIKLLNIVNWYMKVLVCRKRQKVHSSDKSYVITTIMVLNLFGSSDESSRSEVLDLTNLRYRWWEFWLVLWLVLNSTIHPLRSTAKVLPCRDFKGTDLGSDLGSSTFHRSFTPIPKHVWKYVTVNNYCLKCLEDYLLNLEKN